MKTLSAVSRKAHSNVLSLARSNPGSAARSPLAAGCAVPRQDVRISGGYLSARIRMAKSASPSTEKGRRTGADSPKGNTRSEGGTDCSSFRSVHSALQIPDESTGKSVNETVARLLVGATFPDSASRTLENAHALVLC